MPSMACFIGLPRRYLGNEVLYMRPCWVLPFRPITRVSKEANHPKTWLEDMANGFAINQTQTIPKELRFTIRDFHRRFPDDESCLEYLKEQRYTGSVAHRDKCGVGAVTSPRYWSSCIRLRLLRKHDFAHGGNYL